MKNEDQRWILNIKYEGQRFITTDSLLLPQINKVFKFWDMPLHKMKFSIKNFFSKCDQFGHIYKEILTGKFQFLCSMLC